MKISENSATSKDENDQLLPELYYIIQRFLALGPCSEAAKILKDEIVKHELLPERIDYNGVRRTRSFDEYNKCLNQLIPADFVKRLCYQLPSLLDVAAPNGMLNVRPSLLSGGRYSLLRSPDMNWVKRKNDFTYSQKCSQLHYAAPVVKTTAITNALLGRKLTGYNHRRAIASDFLINRLELQTSIFCHLSYVFCVAFDRSGHYIFTGADDNLIKLWQVDQARLLFTFRGFSGEITDLTVSHENTLLAAGSCDKTIRVWCLRTGAPVAVLQGHSAMVTTLQFLPYVDGDDRWLISTGNDCGVCFWKWNVESNEFNLTPIKYAERLRVGGQMVCSSHSQGGRFIVTGGTDYYVRVYAIHKGYPERLIETEGHTDRVTSMQWAHRGLRFVSTSRDGIAKIWTFSRQEWKTICLIIRIRYDQEKGPVPVSANDSKIHKLKLTMVTWSIDDSMIVSAASDFVLRVWDSSNGALLRVLQGHNDEVFVLEPHPINFSIVLSAGHDGYCILWDIVKGEAKKKFFNEIEGSGHGAYFDVRFSPDSERLAAVDSHGHLLIFGSDYNENIRKAVREQFFHTDYRPLIRDLNQYAIDEQYQLAPHLMPPPFLVNSDGDPYRPALQRRVPGRENCADEFLMPIIWHQSNGERAEIADAAAVMEPETDVSANRDETVPHNNSTNDTSSSRSGPQPQNNNRNGGRPFCIWATRNLVRPLIPSVLELGTKNRYLIGLDEIKQYEMELAKSPLPVVIEEDNELPSRSCRKRRGHVYGTRKNTHQESQVENAQVNGTVHRRQRLPLSEPPVPSSSQSPPIIPVDQPPTSDQDSEFTEGEPGSSDSFADSDFDDPNDSDYTDDRILQSKLRSRQTIENDQDIVGSSDLFNSDRDEEDGHSEEIEVPKSPIDHSDSSGHEGDVEADGSQLPSTSSRDIVEPLTNNKSSTRPKRTKTRRKEIYIPENLEETRSGRRARRISLASEPSCLADIPEKFLFPDWMTCTVPRKSPYFPQIKDEVVYFPVGHQLYLDAVERLNLYAVDHKNLPWNKCEFQDQEFAIVVNVRFELSPIRLCCLKLAQIHPKTGRKTGLTYNVRYHDIANVIDFIVLRQYYDKSLKLKWKQGDRFQTVIDDNWWFGTIVRKEPFNQRYKNSQFQCFNVIWDNGDEERLSPWDLEPFDTKKCPTKKGACVIVTSEEICSLASYQPLDGEWPEESGMEREICRLCKGVESIMHFALAEAFVAPVDLNAYPTYCLCVEYPVDLSTIKARLDNYFYRRVHAVEFDIRQIYRNAATFNEPRSQIVQQARLLCDILLKFIDDATCDDVTVIYNEAVSSSPSTSKGRLSIRDHREVKSARRRKYMSSKHKESHHSADENDWLEECREIINLIKSENAVSHYNGGGHAGYDSEMSSNADDASMTISWKLITQKIDTQQYETPQHFADDVTALLNNMKISHTNKRSKAYLSAINLRGRIKEKLQPVLDMWRQKHANSTEKRVYNTRNKKLSFSRWSPRKEFNNNITNTTTNQLNGLRTRYCGKRVIQYADSDKSLENSDDQNDNDNSNDVDDRPQIVRSTSSRGRVCKLRRFV